MRLLCTVTISWAIIEHLEMLILIFRLILTLKMTLGSSLIQWTTLCLAPVKLCNLFTVPLSCMKHNYQALPYIDFRSQFASIVVVESVNVKRSEGDGRSSRVFLLYQLLTRNRMRQLAEAESQQIWAINEFVELLLNFADYFWQKVDLSQSSHRSSIKQSSTPFTRASWSKTIWVPVG